MLKALRHTITPTFMVAIALIFQAVIGGFYVTVMAANPFSSNSLMVICSPTNSGTRILVDQNGLPLEKQPPSHIGSLLCQSYCSVFAGIDTPITTSASQITASIAQPALLKVATSTTLPKGLLFLRPNSRAPPLA